MRTFAQKPKSTHRTTSACTETSVPIPFVQHHAVRSLLRLHHGVGIQAGPIQAQLTINPPADIFEQEADRVADQVMRMPEPQLQRACPCGGGCSKCQSEQPSQEHERLQTKRVQASDAGETAAPPLVHEVLRAPGQPLDPTARNFMERRFGYGFDQVRVHTDAKAAESARAVNAQAYTLGRDVVFGAGQYAPGTPTGRRLLAHELTHVAQQGKAATASDRAIQRACSGSVTGNAIVSDKEVDYQRALKAGRYCRDTGFTGLFHGAATCYREVPKRNVQDLCPPGDQVCFDPKTGQCEDSPDIVSSVESQNADGSCNLHGFCSLGHWSEDILTSEPGMVGAGFGLLAAGAMGFTSRFGRSRAYGLGAGGLLGLGLGAAAGGGIGPLASWLHKRGHVPVVGGSLGIAMPIPNLLASTWQAHLYIGTEKRDRAVLGVFYPSLKLGIGLIGEATTGEPGALPTGTSTLTSLLAGFKIDPGKPGGDYVSFFGGPALALSRGESGIGAEAGIAFGRRWLWLDISADVGFSYDPTRQAGVNKDFTLGVSATFGPGQWRR